MKPDALELEAVAVVKQFSWVLKLPQCKPLVAVLGKIAVRLEWQNLKKELEK